MNLPKTVAPYCVPIKSKIHLFCESPKFNFNNILIGVSRVDPFWATMWHLANKKKTCDRPIPEVSKTPQDWKCAQDIGFVSNLKEQEREIPAVDVKRRRSDLFHNLSSFYRCHIWTRHFHFPREFSWNAISSLSWRKASFPQMVGARPAPRLIATFCLMLRTSRELAVTRRCQKFEKNTISRQVSLRSDKQCGSSLSTFVLSRCWWTA